MMSTDIDCTFQPARSGGITFQSETGKIRGNIQKMNPAMYMLSPRQLAAAGPSNYKVSCYLGKPIHPPPFSLHRVGSSSDVRLPMTCRMCRKSPGKFDGI
jgi:hypothetical protein